MNNRYKTIFVIVLLLSLFELIAQQAPGKDENIPFLVTFGNQADTKWGDDDYSQVFFAVIPKNISKPVFIRVFDPDIGGSFDENNGGFNTKTTFAIYGGNGAISQPDSRNQDPIGNYDSGILLDKKEFGVSPEYDQKWYTFGPYNPKEGEYMEEYGGYVIKIIATGTQGNDGNLYRYFLSTSPTKNLNPEGGNLFTFEYSFRLPDDERSISHIYPFIDSDVIAINVNIFDYDNDGFVRLISSVRKGEKVKHSADDQWTKSTHNISDLERKSSMDLQMIKLKKSERNNVVIYITNEYGRLIRFNTIPIGGIPQPKFSIGVK